MHPRTRLVYFYFLRVELLLKTWSQGRRHIVWLPWQRYICRSKYGCFCISPKLTYLHTKIEEGLKIFISNFASLSWRIALNIPQNITGILEIRAKFALKRSFLDYSKQRLIRTKRRTAYLINRLLY